MEEIETPIEIVIQTEEEKTETLVEKITSVKAEIQKNPQKNLKVVSGISFLNVRSSASTTGAKIGKALPGQNYVYTEEQNGWYRINFGNNQSGWVFGEYVEVIEK